MKVYDVVTVSHDGIVVGRFQTLKCALIYLEHKSEDIDVLYIKLEAHTVKKGAQ